MSASTDASWQDIAARKQRDRASKIPQAWKVPSDVLPRDPPSLKDGPQSVLDIPRQFLSRSELAITESHSIASLLTAISTRRLSAEEVATAFCHRAAIAQQLTNCLTEPLFDSCIARAKELDRFLLKNRRPIGPLHGLPISIKDGFFIRGVDSSIGFASLCYKPAKVNAPLVDLLLSLGCVIVAKTNIPQLLASLDSINNVFGRTMNPINRLLSAGGSSGGEGVLVAMKGSMIGFGTDIGGSIRVPAAHNAVYGFKPSNGRLPYGGQSSSGIAGLPRASLTAVAGPLARSVQDLDIVLREIMPRAKLFGEDCVPSYWSTSSSQSRSIPSGSGPNNEFVIGILRSDGNCELLPPIAKLMNEVSNTLRRTPGIKVIDLPTPPAWTKTQSIVSKLMGVEGSQQAVKLLDKEPLVPWMTTRFRAGTPATLSRLAELQSQRTDLEREMLSLWVSTDEHGRRHRTLDVLISPVAPHPTPEIDRYNAVGMTSSWVLLDYPAGTIPVREFTEGDLELGVKQSGKAISSWDEKNRELWDESLTDRRVYLGSVMSVQVVTARAEDEALVQAMRVVDGVVGLKRDVGGDEAGMGPRL